MSLTSRTPEDFLIVALDLPTADDALQMVESLGDTVTFYKIGMELFYASGRTIVEALLSRQKRIFLDLKINDIPNTVAGAVRSLSSLGVDYLTLFTSEPGVAAAVPEAGDGLRLLNVTVLTSDLPDNVSQRVEERTAMTIAAGGHGVICSGHETAALRAKHGDNFVIINPGVRPAGSAADDQKRIVTPVQAWTSGASHIVVGRPITRADEPAAVARAIRAELPAATG